jgi:hypothetical protein
VSKLPEESDLKAEMNKYFEEPDKYLKFNPYMVVGKNNFLSNKNIIFIFRSL